MDRFIGLKGTGNNIEFNIIKETPKAYLLGHEDTEQSFWMPKGSFDDSGNITDYGYDLLCEKLILKEIEL